MITTKSFRGSTIENLCKRVWGRNEADAVLHYLEDKYRDRFGDEWKSYYSALFKDMDFEEIQYIMGEIDFFLYKWERPIVDVKFLINHEGFMTVEWAELTDMDDEKMTDLLIHFSEEGSVNLKEVMRNVAEKLL